MEGGAHPAIHTWGSEDNLQESILSFHFVVSGTRTQIIRFGSKHLYALSHLTSPGLFFLKYSLEGGK